MSGLTGAESIRVAGEMIRRAKAVVITSGAGMGVDSGLPDFRGVEGFWRAYPPMKHLDLKFEEMSTPSWFSKDPQFAWGFFGHRHKLYSNAQPHKGYQLLREIAEAKKHGYFVFTSNVDGHFERAGFKKERIVECHGSLRYFQCTVCDAKPWSSSNMEIDVDETTFRATSALPKCPSCGALARPNVCMFNDPGWDATREYTQSKKFQEFTTKLAEDEIPFVVIEIGAGSYVPTVRLTSESLVKHCPKASLLRINPRDGEIPDEIGFHAKHSLALGGLDALQQIADYLAKKDCIEADETNLIEKSVLHDFDNWESRVEPIFNELGQRDYFSEFEREKERDAERRQGGLTVLSTTDNETVNAFAAEILALLPEDDEAREIISDLATISSADPSAGDHLLLRQACRFGLSDTVAQLLCDSRVDPTACDNEAMSLATVGEHTDVVMLLLHDDRVIL